MHVGICARMTLSVCVCACASVDMHVHVLNYALMPACMHEYNCLFKMWVCTYGGFSNMRGTLFGVLLFRVLD